MLQQIRTTKVRQILHRANPETTGEVGVAWLLHSNKDCFRFYSIIPPFQSKIAQKLHRKLKSVSSILLNSNIQCFYHSIPQPTFFLQGYIDGRYGGEKQLLQVALTKKEEKNVRPGRRNYSEL